MLDNRTKLQDALSILNDSNFATIGGALAAWASTGSHGIATTAATAVWFDTGGGFTEGKLVIDIRRPSNIVAGVGENIVPADNQKARFILQGSTVTAFTTSQELASMFWGWNDLNAGGTVGLFGLGQASPDFGANTRYIIPWNNQYGAKIYRYLRMWIQYRGTWATGLAYDAFLTK